MEDIKRIYANVKLPVDVYPNGEFKMLYNQMQIKMEIPNISFHKNVIEMKKEIEERIQDNLLEEEEEEEENNKNEKEDEELEIKIYKSDYPPQKYKKRWNTTFKKNIKGNKLTKKNYLVINETDSEHNLLNSDNSHVVSYPQR